MKSLVACFLILLLLTAPAVWMAPPNRRNFSVRVVLPASGWEIMAKVLRLLISLLNLFIGPQNYEFFPKDPLRGPAEGPLSDSQPLFHRLPDGEYVIGKPQCQHTPAKDTD